MCFRVRHLTQANREITKSRRQVYTFSLNYTILEGARHHKMTTKGALQTRRLPIRALPYGYSRLGNVLSIYP